jgi:hypothetical protein
MFGNQNNQVKPRTERKDNCKIKVKTSSDGKSKTIGFEGNCSKEQIQIARENINEFNETENKN